MRFTRTVALLGAVTVLSACDTAGTASLDTDDQKASYGIGLDMGRSLRPAASHMDIDAFVAGVRDALEDAEPAVSREELDQILQEFSRKITEEQQAERAAQAERNQAEGEAFLAENGAREGVVTTESGLQYEVLEAGDGPRPTAADQVTIHYKGTLIDGTQFDSSYDRGEPATFGVSGVIQGFAEGLQLMPVGSRYRFVIPADLAYGAQGAGGEIGPNATLIFEIELLEIGS